MVDSCDTNSGKGLAEVFLKYYSGHIYNCYRVLRRLVGLKNKCNPFAIAQPDNIQCCIEDRGVPKPSLLCKRPIEIQFACV